MITRRSLLAAAATAGLALASPALAQKVKRIPRDWLPTDVEVKPGLPGGVIYVDIANTWLYFTLQDGVARRYKTAVSAAGRNFRGQARGGRKWERAAGTPRTDPGGAYANVAWRPLELATRASSAPEPTTPTHGDPPLR